MNNKTCKIFFILIAFSFFTINVNATCNDKDLNDWAEKVNIEFKEEKETKDYTPEFAYVLLMSPYNDKVNMEATDTYSEDFYKIEYDKYYKTNAIGSYVHFEEKTYTIRFYGNEKSSCNGELLREIEYKVPSYNNYSLSEFCQDDKYKDQDICKMNTDTANVSVDEFEKKIEKIQKEDVSLFMKIINGILRYWYYAIIPFVLVAGVYYYKVYLYKKEQKKK